MPGCSSKNNLVGKHEIFTDDDMKLFQNEKLSISIDGKKYTLGMTKKEIEEMLGETGKGYAYSGTKTDSSNSKGSYIPENKNNLYKDYFRL